MGGGRDLRHVGLDHVGILPELVCDLVNDAVHDLAGRAAKLEEVDQYGFPGRDQFIDLLEVVCLHSLLTAFEDHLWGAFLTGSKKNNVLETVIMPEDDSIDAFGATFVRCALYGIRCTLGFMNDSKAIDRLLTDTKTWAIVGLSDKAERASNRVAARLQSIGMTVIPVNPIKDEILGEKSYPNLASIPVEVDVVDIFRRSGLAGVHVDEAIEIGAKAVWMQLDVIDTEAANRAEMAGLDVVMDRCPAIELRRRGR